MKSVKIVLCFQPQAADKWQWTLPELGTDYIGGDCATHSQAVAEALQAAAAIHKKEHQAHIDTARESADLLSALFDAVDAAK